MGNPPHVDAAPGGKTDERRKDPMEFDREQLRTTVWHAEDLSTVHEQLETSKDGLSQQEAEERLGVFGPNTLRPPKKRSALIRFLAHFHNILIYILLAAAVVTAFLGEWLDTWVILGVVLVNTVIGFIQEGKAEKALEAIAKMVSLEATAVRDGSPQRVDAETLVPGDVVVLEAGDKVPADLRLMEARECAIDEAVLTGESAPVHKGVSPLDAKASVGDRTCMAFSSTLVTAGTARGVVVATANDTQIGRISELVEQSQEIMTPLMQKIEVFGRILAVVIVGVAAFTFLFGLLVGEEEPVALFLAAVAIAVAAIPEGLPAIMTVTLAIGVQRMASRRAIIRKLPAVDTLGAITTICSDKTGTLTRNEMMVQHIYAGATSVTVSGQGYDPYEGSFVCEGEPFDCQRHPALLDGLRAGLLCNDAYLRRSPETELWEPVGDPMEGALLVAARKAGFDETQKQKAWPRVDSVPFDSSKRYMATLHHPKHRDREDQALICVKGALERVLEMCTHQRKNAGEAEQDIDPVDWLWHAEAWARAGQRVLAMAWKTAPLDKETLEPADLEEGGFTMLAIVGIMDPVRQEAVESVNLCRKAGIKVKMLTGDHALTATAIGAQLGIGDGETALTGADIEEASDEALAQHVRDVDVFARVSPEHKLRLVKALQANGEVVGMTGDGVNDAPALKNANVGIAMGIKGTEVSKEASEMILTDDNFASIVNAVEEGRTVYTNLRKAILFLLPTNGGQALTIIAAIMAGYILPITPVQILWVNMITAVTLAVALAFEPPEAGIMHRPPRDPDQPLITKFFLWRIAFVSVTRAIGIFALFIWVRHIGMEDAYARTLAVNTLVMFEVFYLFNVRYIKESTLNLKGLLENRLALLAAFIVIAGQLLFSYAPFMQQLFDTTGISLFHWVVLLVVTGLSYFLIEGEKWLIRRREAALGREVVS